MKNSLGYDFSKKEMRLKSPKRNGKAHSNMPLIYDSNVNVLWVKLYNSFF
ncbi:hypothetical protein Hanom_Chr13g01232281 [Helianthus anomalus]